MALTSLEIKHAKEGMHSDGNGLYLRVQAGGAKSWIFRFQLKKKRREMGIGTLADKPAVDARLEAAMLSKKVRDGIDPIEERKQQAAELAAKAPPEATFDDVSKEYIAAHRAGWKNAKHASQWTNTLATYASPIIGKKAPKDISTEDVLAILQPIWTTKTETASRVRNRIELVLSYAKAKKLRQGENPAAWRGHLDNLLPAPKKVKKVAHHPALPYAQMPEFMKMLRACTGIGAAALEFLILTAARPGNVANATWDQIDTNLNVWTIPEEDMKVEENGDHLVPLSSAAQRLLSSLPRIEGEKYIFPGTKLNMPISDATMRAVIERDNERVGGPRWIDPKYNREIVPHGFRSSFRDWAGDMTHYAKDLAEMALAHAIENKAEAAYRRMQMLEKRRPLMEDWAAWCGNQVADSADQQPGQ